MLTMTRGHVDAIARFIAPDPEAMEHVRTLDPEGDIPIPSDAVPRPTSDVAGGVSMS